MNAPFRPYKPVAAASAKAAISRGIAEAGGPRAVVLRMKRRKSAVYAYGDADHPTHAPFDAVCALVQAGATAPVEHLAMLAGGFFVAASAPREQFAALFSRAARQRGDMEAQTLDALADGVIDARERGALVDALGQQIAALNAARARLLREGAQGADDAMDDAAGDGAEARA